jgi:hypothetical protein
MWMVRASFVVVVSLLGLGAQLAWPRALEAGQDALHEVMPGDNLHLIAGYYYGDARQWERIWQANRDQIPNPNRIKRGSLLRIPDAVLPDESYAEFLSRARGVVTPLGAPARSEVPTAGEAPPASAGPGREPTSPPGPGGPTGPPAKQP